MRSDVLFIASVPLFEHAARPGSPGYEQRAPTECRALIGQLRRERGAEPPGAVLVVAANCVDDGLTFGYAYGVNCQFDPGDTIAEVYAYDVEHHLPATWDDQSRRELANVLPPDYPAPPAVELVTADVIIEVTGEEVPHGD